MNLVKVKGKEKERERLQKYIYGVTYQNRISSSIIATITPKTEIAYYSTLVQVAKA
jgi:phage terminase large subunit-like protein